MLQEPRVADDFKTLKLLALVGTPARSLSNALRFEAATFRLSLARHLLTRVSTVPLSGIRRLVSIMITMPC